MGVIFLVITPITSERKLRRFFTYDFEWVPGLMRFRIGGLYDGAHYRCFGSVDSFLDAALTSANRGAWFFAHYGGMADIQFLLGRLTERGYIVKASLSGSSAIIVHVGKGKNWWHFVDSFWLLRESLAEIGKAIGMKKGGPDDADPNMTREKIKEWYATVPIQELRDYNEQDCKILWTAIDQFETALYELGGQLNMTQASSAMGLFRRRFLTRTIETSDSVNARARLAYIASRVEVFSSEAWNSLYYDLNSSFPYSMTFPQPGAFLTTTKTLPDDLTGPSLYLANVSVRIPDCYLPPLPYRIGGRVFFPIGEWTNWFTSADVQTLIAAGGKVTRVYEVLYFEPFYDLAEYVKVLYAKRQAETSAFGRTVYKFLLNSLYGKFGESNEKRGLVLNPTPELLSRLPSEAMIFPGAYYNDITVPVAHVHVPISANVTALSRRFLYDYMAQTEESHYCDTDGFSTTTEFPESKDLGALKLEKRIDRAQFLAPKLYRLTGSELAKDGSWKILDTVKAKGFSLGKVPAQAITRWESIASGEGIDVDRMVRVRESARLAARNPGGLRPTEKSFVKRLAKPEKRIAKRFMYPDGSTRPYSADELRDWLR